MYYSDEILEEVRSRNDIVDVISSYVKLKRGGSNLMGLCPFHNEKTPSFSVSPRKQMFYCFGCHRGGSVITFVQLYENSTFQEAVEMLAQRGGVALPQPDDSAEERKKADLRSRLFEINRQAGAFYYYYLRSEQGEQGMTYLRGRGLTDETMKTFGLGYAGKYSNSLYKYLKEKGYSDDLLRMSGLMGSDEKRGMYDKFWNRVMFPIMDLNNRIIGFGGRVMGDAKPKYLNSPENEIFNKRRNLYAMNAARRSRENFMILCEGYMDVIALHQAGFTNAVASLGTALTVEHAQLLRKYTEKVILSYDSDSAGVNAALRAIPMLKDQGIDVRILDLSPCKDPDEFIRANGTEAFRDRLSQAKNSFLFEVESIRSRYDLSDPDEKTRFFREVAAHIAAFDLQAQRENYIEAAAPVCGIGFDALRQMVEHVLTAGTAQRRAPRVLAGKTAVKPDEGLRSSQRLLLGWLTKYPSLYDTVKKIIPWDAYTDPVYAQAAKVLYEQLESGSVNEAAVMDHFSDPSQQSMIAELFHSELETESAAELKKAISETILKIAEGAASTGGKAESAQPDAGMTDIALLQQKVERKRALDRLKKHGITIDLGEMEETEED